jgi:hypothetical protein
MEDDMALQSHIAELAEKHRVLHKQIEEERARPAADDIKLAELKRKKLRLKDKIEKLSQQSN